jgi:hypothetical protein
MRISAILCQFLVFGVVISGTNCSANPTLARPEEKPCHSVVLTDLPAPYITILLMSRGCVSHNTILGPNELLEGYVMPLGHVQNAGVVHGEPMSVTMTWYEMNGIAQVYSAGQFTDGITFSKMKQFLSSHPDEFDEVSYKDIPSELADAIHHLHYEIVDNKAQLVIR